MSLIKCPECGKEISDRADACIHCGFPVAKYREEEQETKLCDFCDSKNKSNETYCRQSGGSITTEKNWRVWYTVFWCIVIPPAGIILMWLWKIPEGKGWRVFFTVFILLILFLYSKTKM